MPILWRIGVALRAMTVQMTEDEQRRKQRGDEQSAP